MPPASPVPRLAFPFQALLAAFALASVGLHYHPRPGLAWLHALTIWAVVLGSTIGCVVGYRRLRSAQDCAATRRLLIVGAVPLWVLAVSIEPFDSLDLAGYLNNGRLPVVYGLNPYVTPVDRVPGWRSDVLLADNWHDTVCAYGFLFAELAAAVVAASGESREQTYLFFKLVNVAALGLTVWLVDRGCRQACVSRSVGIWLVAWNPLVLLHGLSNGHNDLLAGLGLIAAIVAARGRLWWAVLPLLAATALIKYSTVPLVPLAMLFLLRRHGWVRTAIGAAIAAALVAVIAGPYLADGSTLEGSRNFSNVTQFLNSFGSLVVIPLQMLGKFVPGFAVAGPIVSTALKVAGGLLLVGLTGALFWKRARSEEYSDSQFLHDVVLVQFAMIAIASPKFYAWYLLMFWPTVAMLPEASRLRRTILAVGLAQMGSFTFLSRAHIVSPLVLLALPLAWIRELERRRFPPKIVASPPQPTLERKAA